MKRVLITGATGFIGARLAEALTERGFELVCLVRSWSRAPRLARLPVRMVGGDVLDLGSVRGAMSGCDVVMHCAVDNRARGRAHKRTSGQGTRNVMQAARELGASRVVHLSSAAVHGLSPPAGRPVTETSPLRRTGNDYCDGKILGERVALEYHRSHGLPVSILRPTVVYGPFGYYSEAVARAAREGRLVLVDGAEGVCNCLYVDNLIQAMILAAERDEAVGEVFHISDAAAVTWRRYLEGHARALGPSFTPLPVVSRKELQLARRRLRREALKALAGSSVDSARRLLRDPAIRQGVLSLPGAERSAQAAQALIDKLPTRVGSRVGELLGEPCSSGERGAPSSGELPMPLSRAEEESFSVFRNVTFGIDKAENLLGYAPAVDFEEGIARTAAWIRWARI